MILQHDVLPRHKCSGVGFLKSIKYSGTKHVRSVTFEKTAGPGSSARASVKHSWCLFPFDLSKVGVRTHCERHRLQGPAAVPPESEEPRHDRLPPSQAQISVGLAQLSPVSLLGNLNEPTSIKRLTQFYSARIIIAKPTRATHPKLSHLRPQSCSQESSYSILHSILFYSGITTAWTPSATTTCWTPPLDVKWPRDTRPVSAWRTRAVSRASGGATPVRPTRRYSNACTTAFSTPHH